MTLRSLFPTFIRLYRVWCERLSLGGKALSVVLILAIPSLGAPESPLAILFGSAFALLTASAAANFFFRPHLKTVKPVRVTTNQGEVTSLLVSLRNESLRVAFDLDLELETDAELWEPHSQTQRLDEIGPQQEANASFQLQPLRRGVFRLPKIIVTSSFPLNLVRRSWRLSVPGELTVFPRYPRLDSIRDVFRSSGFAGERLSDSALVGHSSEYSGSREYLPGVAVRRWDYASWARVGSPVIREFGDDQQTQFAIVVDTCQADPLDTVAQREFEAMLSFAACLADWLLEHDCRVSAMAIGGKLYRLKGEGGGQLESVLRGLAAAGAEPETAFKAHAAEWPHQVIDAPTVLMLSTCWDDRRQEVSEHLGESYRPVHSFLVSDSSTSIAKGLRCVAPGDVLASSLGAV